MPYNDVFNLSMVSPSVDSKSFGNSTYTSSEIHAWVNALW